MSEIDQLPRERTFGKSFDYSQWSGKTSQATMYRVPWASDYRDIAVFPTHAKITEYLEKCPKFTGFNFSYLKYNQPVKFDVPMNEALKYNYLRVWNPEQPIHSTYPDSSRYLYYFINDVVYDSPNSTRLVLQLDIVATFLREIEFGQAYLEQGHAGVAESTVKPATNGILAQPEGLNLGADYVVGTMTRYDIADAESSDYDVMVVSTTDLESSDHGTKEDPNLKTATGSDFENLPNGTNLYVFGSPEQFKAYVKRMSDKPWVLQGIVSVTAIPGGLEGPTPKWPRVSLDGVEVMKPDKTSKIVPQVHKLIPNLAAALMNLVDDRYKYLKKFSVYPYSFVEISTYTGDPLVLKPELWADPDASIVIKSHIAPPSPRIGIRPFGYNTEFFQPYTSGDPDGDDLGESWNVATWLANFPQFSIVNNGYLQTMAAQAHSISQSYKDAGWQQQKALSGNAMAYDQSTSGMNLANDLTQNSVSNMQQQTSLANTTTGAKAAISAGTGLARGAVGGAAGVGMAALGALGTGMNAAVDINQQTQSSALQQRLAQQQNSAQVGQQGFIRDTNKNFADFATKGDYSNAINTINAKVEDAKLTQPTTAGTVGGDAFMLAIDGWAIRAKIKIVPAGARRAIGEYWLRYGYAVNRFVKLPKNFQCMTIFTYWKVKETYILKAQCPEPVKQALRGIFEKGVTVWHDPYRMGDPAALADNRPIYANYIQGE